MMCPPFCFFMPAVSRTADRLLSRSCAACRVLAQKKVSTSPNPPSMRCSGPLASGVELRPGPFRAALSPVNRPFLERLLSATLTASFDQTQRRFCCVTSVSTRHGGAWVWLPDSSATLSRNRRAYTFPHEYDTGRTISRAATPVPGR